MKLQNVQVLSSLCVTTIDHTSGGEKFMSNANLGAWINTVHTSKETMKLSYDIDTSTNM